MKGKRKIIYSVQGKYLKSEARPFHKSGSVMGIHMRHRVVQLIK